MGTPGKRKLPVQSSALLRKIAVRKALADKFELSDTGGVYVPYCGDGECYAEVEGFWPSEQVFAVDRDVGAVRRFGEKWPEAQTLVADVTKAVEFPPDMEFQIADFDAYGSPHLAVTQFFEKARKTKRLGVVITDGSARFVKIQGRLWDFRRGRAGRFDREAANEQLGSWGELRRDWLAYLCRGKAEVIDTDWNKNKTTFYGSFIVEFDETVAEEIEETALPPDANAEAIQQLLNAHWSFALEDQDAARFCLSLLKERMKLEAQGVTAPPPQSEETDEDESGDWMDRFLGED